MRQLDMTIAVAALTVILISTLSARLEGAPASRPMLALLLGLAAGPQALGLLRPDLWPQSHLILEEAARLTLAISVAGIAIRTPFHHLAPAAAPAGPAAHAGDADHVGRLRRPRLRAARGRPPDGAADRRRREAADDGLTSRRRSA